MRNTTINRIQFNSVQDFKTRTPQIFTMIITPNIADEILATSNNNRKLSTQNVENLVREMRNNNYNWRTGETIKFDANGVLRDGHHRLKAIIDSNTTQEMLIYTCAESIEKIDSGKSRSLADSFIMSDNADNKIIAKLGVNILRIKNNAPLSNVGYKKEFSIDEVIKLCNDEKEFLETIYYDLKYYRKENNWVKKYPKTEPSVIGSIIYEMVKVMGYNYYDVMFFTKHIFSRETSPIKD